MKSIKEKQLLVKWAKAMNTPIDPLLVDEVERYNQIQSSIVESIRVNSINDLIEARNLVQVEEVKQEEKELIDYPKPPTLDEVLSLLEIDKNAKDDNEQTLIAENLHTTETPKSLAEITADRITKEVKLEEKADSFQQPSVDAPRTLSEIKRKIKYLEEWLGKVSLAGPGGGAGDIINLDMPTKVVTGDYTVTRRDYYIGVNADVKTYITLPDPTTVVNGREVIIKDESGHAQLTPIKVIGKVDNNPNGFEIKINNGSVTLIYRDGWRII